MAGSWRLAPSGLALWMKLWVGLLVRTRSLLCHDSQLSISWALQQGLWGWLDVALLFLLTLSIHSLGVFCPRARCGDLEGLIRSLSCSCCSAVLICGGVVCRIWAIFPARSPPTLLFSH